MNYKELYEKELLNPNTNYLILDTSGAGGNEHGDVDFSKYYWHSNKFNKISEGDLFIYRRQQKASEFRNEFYFFGAGRIEKIDSLPNREMRATISKPFIFKDKLLKKDLTNFQWKFKERKKTWQNFFNEYGMSCITREDFVNILDLQEGALEYEDETDSELEIKFYQNQQKGDYRVEDANGNVKVRGAAHRVFADKVKANYEYTCAITGIRTKEFLVASHIIPWSKDKDNRINPLNGICLSSLVDKAFDKGYISISDDLKVIVSEKIKNDKELFDIIKPYEGKKLNVRRKFAPDKNFLKWHRENIFKR